MLMPDNGPGRKPEVHFEPAQYVPITTQILNVEVLASPHQSRSTRSGVDEGMGVQEKFYPL